MPCSFMSTACKKKKETKQKKQKQQQQQKNLPAQFTKK